MMGRMIFIVGAISLGGLIGWMAFLDRQIPYEYLSGRIYPSPAKQASQIALDWTIKVNRLCPGNVHRLLYDADTSKLVYSYDRTPSAISVKMGDTSLPKSFWLPPQKLPPNIRYAANVCFPCNILQNLIPSLAICVPTPDLFFSVEQ